MKKVIISLVLIVAVLLTAGLISADTTKMEYIWPVGGDNYGETYIEYFYGKRTYDSNVYDQKYNYAPYELDYSKTENHYGVDITGIKGESYDIVSVSDGEVVATSADRRKSDRGINFADSNQRKSSTDGGGYGNYIVIEEKKTGKVFLYAHLKAGSITLKKGDSVKIGQKIGVMGSSGDSGHMHLHFEVRKNVNTTLNNGGKSLVVTTGYGIETLDPTNYIGTEPTIEEETKEDVIVDEPEQVIEDEPKEEDVIEEQPKDEDVIEEPKEEVIEEDSKEEQPKEEVIPAPTVSPAKVRNIGIVNNKTYKQVDIYFTNPVNVEERPMMYVQIGSELEEASYVNFSEDGMKLSYKINYNDFEVMTYGDINISLVGGKIVTRGASDFIVDTSNVKLSVGTLSSYRVINIYSNIINKQAGDVNLDGEVNSQDASIVLHYYATGAVLTEEEMKVADVNCDGRVDAVDASQILSYSAKVGAGNNLKEIINCDINDDEVIDVKDYEMLKSAVINDSTDSKYDINQDGSINSVDTSRFLMIVKANGSR